MINSRKVLAIIPARGGSKGVKRKNIKMFAGKPLIAWTIEEAKKSKYIDRLILSSEDEEIIGVAKDYGCEVPFIRPEELALDETPGIEPILHALDKISGYDYVVVLQPTSPLRIAEDIDVSLERMVNSQAGACVSVVEAEQSPYWMYTISEENKIRPLISQQEMPMRRQELSKVYALNGAVYIAGVEWIKRVRNFLTEETISYIMPKERSFDIDNEMDFAIAEFLKLYNS